VVNTKCPKCGAGGVATWVKRKTRERVGKCSVCKRLLYLGKVSKEDEQIEIQVQPKPELSTLERILSFLDL
jgi:hypothetical protein